MEDVPLKPADLKSPAKMPLESKIETPNSSQLRGTWQLFLAAFAVNMASLMAGSIQTWLSPAIPYLKSNATHLPRPIDNGEEGWIGSLAALGSAIGPIPAGLLADKIGRRPTLLVDAGVMAGSWVLAIAATGSAGIAMIMIARLVGGIAIGAVYTVVPMYIGEIATPNLRAMLGTLLQLQLCMGFLVPYCVGPWSNYLALGIISALPVLVFVAVFSFCPDSPSFLMAKGKAEAAHKSLTWIRGGADVTPELVDVRENLKRQPAKPYGEQLHTLLKSQACRRGLEIGFAVVAFQQFSGINAVIFFGQTIFSDAGISIDPAIATIVIGVTLTLASLLGSVLAGYFSSKVLLLASSAGLIVTNVMLVIYYTIKESRDVSEFGWVPVATLVVYIVVYCIGWGPLPWAIIGEIFPQDVKGLASGLCATFCWLLGFLITRFFGDINRSLGYNISFGIFAVFCLLSGIYTQYRIPNTKGKTMQEVQEILAK